MKLFTRVILPLILFGYIALDTYLKSQNIELCHSTGCELAGELLRFDSIYLNYFGAIGALLIALIGYISIRREEFEKLFFSIAIASVAFESIMIAYQVIANPEPCTFCMGVYAQLLLILLANSRLYLLYSLPIIGAIFISMASLAVPANRSMITKDGYYLLHSEQCPHCKKVKEYMAKNSIEYTPISIVDPNGRMILKTLGYKQIPVLVTKRGASITMIRGDKNIIAKLSGSGSDEESSSDQTPNLDNPDDGGCEASVFKESNCEEESVLKL